MGFMKFFPVMLQTPRLLSRLKESASSQIIPKKKKYRILNNMSNIPTELSGAIERILYDGDFRSMEVFEDCRGMVEKLVGGM